MTLRINHKNGSKTEWPNYDEKTSNPEIFNIDENTVNNWPDLQTLSPLTPGQQIRAVEFLVETVKTK